MELLHKMQDILDSKSPQIHESSEESERDSDDEMLPNRDNVNFNKAEAELGEFEKFKKKKYQPTIAKAESGGLSGEYEGSIKEIVVGQVTARGKDFPSGKNLADYIYLRGRMDLISFFQDHAKYFPTKWILVQCERTQHVTEVGCEHFFGLSGNISSPCRTRLGVRNYERLVMLASILNVIYIEPEWVTKEYLCRCKKGRW